MTPVSSYSSPGYAAAFAEFADPRPLEGCGGWLLEREIGSQDARDAMGPYPIFDCADWSALPGDLAALERQGGLVSVACVPDPFGDYDPVLLERSFRDVVRPFKQHFTVDLERDPDSFVSRRHRTYTHGALREVRVELEPDPNSRLDDWCSLFDRLVERHSISGLQAFSRTSFERQLALDDVVMLLAFHGSEVVGGHIWFLGGDVGRSHLVAVSDAGYELRASYALYWEAIRLMRGRVRWLNLGGGAGSQVDGNDGLSQFKRGFSSDSRTAYFCGRVLDRDAYDRLVADSAATDASYFPAYRAGELA